MVIKARGDHFVHLGRKLSLNADHTAVLRTVIRERQRSSPDEVARPTRVRSKEVGA